MIEQHIISQNKILLDALKAINQLNGKDSLTLFVEDDNHCIIGTLTDGDIRRSLINGSTLETVLKDVSHKNYSFIIQGEYDIHQIHDAKLKGIELIPVLNDQKKIIDLVNLKRQKSYLPIDAVLMAGGKGERLRPLTNNTPKPLLEMGGKAIIDYIIEQVLSYGVKNISVTVNYLKEQIEEHFASPFNGVHVKTVSEPKYLGTIGSLSYVNDFQNDTILLMNSDAITDINLEEFYLHFCENDADMSVAAVPYSVSIPYGILELNEYHVKGIQEKPTYNYYANAGIYLIRRELLSLIPAGDYYNATDFLEFLLNKGYKVTRFPINGTWIDIGNMQDFIRAKEIVKHLENR